MKAKIENSRDKNRQKLHEIIPLDTPFSVMIEPISYCNLKCNFCIHSLFKDEMIKKGHTFARMECDIFDLIIEQLKDFSSPIKAITFVGLGEPLLHNDLPYMIHKIKSSGVAETIWINTNGTLLTRKLSEDLVNAGLDNMRISANGLSDDDFEKNCGVRIDFNKYISEIEYLYKIKRDMYLHIKGLDTNLNGKSKEEFFDTFGRYCDGISLDHTRKVFQISYDKLNINPNFPSTDGGSYCKTEICSQLFYRMSISADGGVGFCCQAFQHPSLIGGNVREESLLKMWNSISYHQMKLNMLKGNLVGILAPCRGCSSSEYILKDDLLDPYANELYERLVNIKREN